MWGKCASCYWKINVPGKCILPEPPGDCTSFRPAKIRSKRKIERRGGA